MKILDKLLYHLRFVKPEKIAKRIGVRQGNNCRFFDDPYRMFGTEPYLVTVGNNVEISNGTRFVTHDGGVYVLRTLYPSDFGELDKIKPISVGNNVYFGFDCIILPGVKIGNNVVIGAHSLVSRDIPDDVVVGGVPAKVIESLDEYKIKILKNSFPTKKMSRADKKEYLRKVCLDATIEK